MTNFGNFKDDSNDICVMFKRKVCYGCPNCLTQHFFDAIYCFTLTPYENNHIKLNDTILQSLINMGNLNIKLNNFYNKINPKINRYNYILNNLELNITYMKEKTLNENIVHNYLNPINNLVNNILNQKYKNVLLKSIYDYYRKNFERKIENILADISKRWIDTYNNLFFDIQMNYYKLKNSLYEFSLIGEIYQEIIKTDITKNYFNSIILFQRAELNYTISYYYNYLMKLMNKSYKYIIKKIPINENDFNDIIKIRKEEIKNTFEELINEIKNSENEYLSLEKQLNILDINENDFFKAKSILEKNINEVNNALSLVIDDIFVFETIIPEGDEFSMVMRFYLENKELGKLIEKYYEPVDKEVFFYLKLDKFKSVMSENWLFDSYDFINSLNKELFDTNKEIKNKLQFKLDNYSILIENEISKFFDDDIENIIDNIFSNQLKDMTRDQKNNNEFLIIELMNEFENEIEFEANRIKNNPGIYNLNIKKIKNKIMNYKDILYNKLNNSYFNVSYEFYQEVYKTVYLNCIEINLNKFLNRAKFIAI